MRKKIKRRFYVNLEIINNDEVIKENYLYHIKKWSLNPSILILLKLFIDTDIEI